MNQELKMQKFLLSHGWLKRGATGWVKKEWQDELDSLGDAARNSPLWQHQESIYDAYLMAIVDDKDLNTKKSLKDLLEDIIIIISDNDDGKSKKNKELKKFVFEKYVTICENDISEEFEKRLGIIL